LVSLQYLQIGRALNRVRFVEESLNEVKVFIYYKIYLLLTIHLDNIVAIIFPKTLFALSGPWQMFAVINRDTKTQDY